MTRQLAEEIGGGIICIAALAAGLATAPWWALGVLAFCLVLS